MTERTTGDARGSEGRSPGRRALEWLAARNGFVVAGALFAAGLLADRAGLVAVAFACFVAAGVVPMLLATVSTAEDGRGDGISTGTRLRFLAGQLRWAVTPWGILTQGLQIGGTLAAYARYRGRPPDRERHVPATRLSLPFDGAWTTVNGGVTRASSHSWEIVSQRYAYDFVVTDEDGDTHAGEGERLVDYYAFGRPMRAPADGTVVETRGDLRDYPDPGSGWIEWRTWEIAGNHVVIEHADGEYSLLAHLREGSLTVEPGETVRRGDVVGECGNSGISTEPHLHYQLQDSRSFWLAAGLVPRFDGVRIDRDDDRRAGHEPYGPAADGPTHLRAGDRVAPANGGEW